MTEDQSLEPSRMYHLFYMRIIRHRDGTTTYVRVGYEQAIFKSSHAAYLYGQSTMPEYKADYVNVWPELFARKDILNHGN